jgi:antitoxin CptB
MGDVGMVDYRMVVMSAELNRLRWRCRRGTRELDQLFGWWLEERYPAASDSARQAFAALLEAQDPDLWNWVLGNGSPVDADQIAVINEIRTRHRV